MFDQLQFILGQCTDSTAKAYLRSPPGADVGSLSASLYGPHCQFSRTLASDFALRASADGVQEVLVTEPCYWTPALPFLYELKVNLAGREQTVPVGLRRWTCSGQSFRMEGRRTVLRGAATTIGANEVFANAREAEIACLIRDFSDDACAAADRLGVPLVVDLRNAGDSLFSILDRLDWSASVLVALVSTTQLADAELIRHWPRQCLLAHCLTAASTPDELDDPNTEALAIELAPAERPPAWLSEIDRPLIAIRQGKNYASPAEARAACDRLQAELAPDFNLAGYFVAP